ncbi:MAG: hypothetical protein HUU16_15895 [Candidatus Omnitrophica bacterium]|nr:hypothetical protein [bacterium]NUN97647.1 hypothetical protein [Candidatus Omnitrophota bacterium]
MPRLTQPVRYEYETLFGTCVLAPRRERLVEKLLERILAGKPRYDRVSEATGVPWHVIAILHSLEAGRSFDLHLHNGDPLSARTVRAPAGRPKQGHPPFTWEASAEDALRLKRMDRWTDWSLAGTLFQLEVYNGFGYRSLKRPIPSPYLWSFSNHYTKGKFVEDGRYDPDAVSKQCGAAVLLRRMVETGMVSLAPQPTSPAAVIEYSLGRTGHAEKLQRFLNEIPGIAVKADGVPGRRTSDAVKRVLGFRLVGDPRSESDDE